MDNTVYMKYGIKRDTMLNAALQYASMGLAVFPLEAQGKKPITLHGLKDATTDPDVITEMFTKYPYSNIGMACGSQSGGVVVVDIDVDDEEGIDGNDSLRNWEKEHGELPDTAMTLTGRGGNHYIYRTTEDTKSRIACREGIDIRADGGYIVLPPSIHPNGTKYEWEHNIDDFGIQDADKSVIDLMNEGTEPGKKLKLPKAIGKGERNDTLYKLACSMQARDNSDEAIMAAVMAENRSRCSPPLPDEEVERIVKSAIKKPKGTAPYTNPKPKAPDTEELEMHTFDELRAMDLKAPEFLIDGVLPKGIGILGAPPKIGKSWMALDIAIQVASGGEFLGHKCKKAGVLYLALEDSWYRLQERTEKIQEGGSVPDRLHFIIKSEVVEPGKTDRGLYKQIEMALDKYKDVELVIIDTLQMVTPSKQRGDDAYASTYTLLNSIRPFWQERQVAFLLVHHTRKRSINDVDPFETFLGSQGLTGATDAMYIISKRDKDVDYCDFYGRGRDFEDVIVSIRRNPDTCRWEALGSPEDIAAIRERIEYKSNPIVKAMNKIMDQTDGRAHKILQKDFRQFIQDEYGEVAGTSDRNFTTELRNLTGRLLERDGILVDMSKRSEKGRMLEISRCTDEDTDGDEDRQDGFL